MHHPRFLLRDAFLAEACMLAEHRKPPTVIHAYAQVGTGFSDVQRKNPPKVGSVISFKYQEIGPHGAPRFPVFLRGTRSMHVHMET